MLQVPSVRRKVPHPEISTSSFCQGGAANALLSPSTKGLPAKPMNSAVKWGSVRFRAWTASRGSFLNALTRALKSEDNFRISDVSKSVGEGPSAPGLFSLTITPNVRFKIAILDANCLGFKHRRARHELRLLDCNFPLYPVDLQMLPDFGKLYRDEFVYL
jgi:hypothetical protein